VRRCMRVDVTTGVAARERLFLIAVEQRAVAVAPALLFPPFMPRTPYDDLEIDPGRNPRGDRDEHLREPDEPDEADEAGVEPERSVARHAEEAEEAEIAEEDILEIADLDDEMDARKGDGPDA
jgi:hypothetical protein